MEFKHIEFLEIKEGVQIPEPRDLTPEEEAAILHKAATEFDPLITEAECEELLRQSDQGLLVSGEEVLRIINELEAMEEKPRKESA
jgi:hypothetical protein